MAHYHASVKSKKKASDGKLVASAHFAYIERSGVFKFLQSDEEKVVAWSANMPAWAATDPSVFWVAADEHERANGAVYRELEAALPRELPLAEQRAIAQRFIDQVLGDRHPHTAAIHLKMAGDGGEQPHIHLMWSERLLDGVERPPELFFKKPHVPRLKKDGTRDPVDPAKGGCRKVNMYERLDEFRELWARLVNEAYAAAGMDLRVDHRSYADQGIDKVPERHLGPERAKELQAARDEAAEAEREANALIAAVEAREAVGSVLESTLKRRNPPPPAPPMPPTFDELPPAPPPPRKPAPEPEEYIEISTPLDIELPDTPQPKRELVPVVRPEDRPAPEPVRVPWASRKPQATSEDHWSDAFIARLITPVPRQAPRKPGERRMRPRIFASGPPEQSPWRDYRLRLLIRAYGTGSALLANAWYIEQFDFGIVMTRFDGSQIADKGSRIEAKYGNQDEVEAMVELAKMKGWEQVTFYGGDDDFKQRAMEEALLRDLKVHATNWHDEQLLRKVKIKLGKPP